jgi:acyl-CoA synthetase (AMP-forming)/AMP-acid ligase II
VAAGGAIENGRATLTAPGAYFELCVEPVRGQQMTVFAHRMRSLREVLDGTRRFPDRVAIVEDEVRLTFASQRALVDALAAALQTSYGVQPGDRVALFAANRWEWIVAFWATIVVGAIPCAYNGWWTDDEFTYATAVVEPSLVIGDDERLARVRSTECAVATLDLDDIKDLLETPRDTPPVPIEVHEDDPAILIFTSGTTGRPKAVSTPHRGIVGFLQLTLFGEAFARVVMTGASAPRAGDPPPTADDVVLVTSPLFHTSALYGAVFRSALKGTTVALLPGRFDPERVLATIERERVTSWLALGSAAPRVCAHPASLRYDTTSVVHIGIGGAPVSPAVQDSIRKAFPNAKSGLTMGYASTETVSAVASIGGPEYRAHPTSTGRPVLTVEVELRDAGDAPVAEGELGEIHVRSPYIMLGYWNDPAASAAVLKPDGWIAMGDVGRMIDGRLYIDTRVRDMILVSAENVAPTEVEYRLEEHPDVLEAAVLAIDDPITGDAVCAVVVTDPSSAIRPDELARWCRSTLAHYKVPTHWHLVREPLPRTASGKLLKPEIRRLVDAAGTT